jgi:S-adenosylmethionine:tRNA ribosyltransferase-isomerase
MELADFDYALPDELIAQHPAKERAASRLLHLDGATGELHDRAFADLPQLVDARDVLVLNDTRVIKARLQGRKSTGGRIELFVERITGEREALALSHSGHPLKSGHRLAVGDGVAVEVLGREADLVRVRFAEPVAAVLERCGAVPLPPYIRHAPGPDDVGRYQTIYAANPGAVAAPTAGLHFDESVMKQIQDRKAVIARLTLHVGAGTFQPVRTGNIAEHRMHAERYAIPEATRACIAGKRVLAVGTTTLRALETHALTGRPEGESDLFITPGFKFRVVQRLLTNFHLPKSTLLMLVAAFAGLDNVRRAYAHAIRERYRFFSYGDAMLIERAA